jgi:hypothetical protein
MRTGETLAADLIVLATGYKGQEYLVRKLFGDDALARSGDSAMNRSCATCSRAPLSRACGLLPAVSRNAAFTPSISACR